MALKKIDVSGIDSAIAETRDDELRQKEIGAQSDLALQIRLFMKEAPYIINEIREAASPMDAQKFYRQSVRISRSPRPKWLRHSTPKSSR